MHNTLMLDGASGSQTKPSDRPHPPVRFVALAIWLLIQLIALLISTAPLHLSRVDPHPMEQIATEIMLCCQLIGLCLLFPILFSNWPTVLLLATTSAVFTQFAQMLSASSSNGFVWFNTQLVIYMVLLKCLHGLLPSSRARLETAALLSGLVLLGPLVRMVQMTQQLPTTDTPFFPLNQLLLQLYTPHPTPWFWYTLLLTAIALSLTLIRQLHHRRHPHRPIS